MKTNVFFFCIIALTFTACKKDNTPDNPNPPKADTYINTTSGSSWTYHEIDSSGTTPVSSDFTVTSTSKDTSINSRSYHIYNYSYGGSQYLNTSGHDYYQFDSMPGGLGTGVFERLYLKDDAAVGASWKQDFSVTIPVSPFPVPVTVTNNITEKGISRTVNGVNYTDVIHVTTSISSILIPATALSSNINIYYAKKYGLIENNSMVNLNFMGITQSFKSGTKLVSAVLK